jgi:hypothetical protein
MSKYNLEEIAQEIPLKMMMTKNVCEPTLWKVQKNSEKSVFGDDNFKSVPAWLFNARYHPGLSEQFFVFDENSCDDEFPLPKLPFDVNRKILYKIVIKPKQNPSKRKVSNSVPRPSMIDIMKNGTIIISGDPLHQFEHHNMEIFLSFHDMLLPCFYCERSEITTNSRCKSSQQEGQINCFYVPDSTAFHEICFMSSDGKILEWSKYEVERFPGSTPYEALQE